MSRKKFTVRVGEDSLQVAREYAAEHDTTLTNLVDAFFRSIRRVREINTETPVLQKMAGSLRPEAYLEEYYAHLEKKYLGSSKPDGE